MYLVVKINTKMGFYLFKKEEGGGGGGGEDIIKLNPFSTNVPLNILIFFIN